MQVTSFVNSLYTSCSYVVNKTTLVDVGDINEGYSNVDKVLLTHCHLDHIYGLNKLAQLNPDLKVYTNEFGKKMLFDAKKNLSYYHETPFVFSYPKSIITVNDGEMVVLETGVVAEAVFTPGHNPSCITWAIGEAMFTGDSFIPGIKTVVNLPGGNKLQAALSVSRILELSKNHSVFPGHYIPSAT